MGPKIAAFEIARNRDPAWESGIPLIVLAPPRFDAGKQDVDIRMRGHDGT